MLLYFCTLLTFRLFNVLDSADSKMCCLGWSWRHGFSVIHFTDSWHKKTSKLAHFYITPKYKKWTIHNGHLWFRHISAFWSLVLQHSLYFSPNCKQRFCSEYQWCKAGFFVSMTFRGEWGMHNLFLQGKSPIGEPTESILHQKNCLSFQLSQLCNSVIPLALPVEKTWNDP